MGQIFHSFDDAEPLGREQLDREGLLSLFDRFDWFARTHAECPNTGAPLIARATNDGRDIWLFLATNPHGKAKSLSSWYTLVFRPVFMGNPNADQRAELLRKVAQQVKSHTSTIRLSPMRKDDCDATAAAFRGAGWVARAVHSDCNWKVQVTGQCFADYLASRPGQLRKTIKAKSAKARMTVTICDRFNPDAWSEYEAIYADSWKPEEGAMQFLRDLAIAEGAAGTLRLGIGHIDGVAVAAQLWTCENGTAIAHKVAHRQSAAHFSPGTLLSAAMFEQAIDGDNVDWIDFGTGNDSYKSAWMADCVPLYTLDLYNPRTLSGLLSAARSVAVWAMRR